MFDPQTKPGQALQTLKHEYEYGRQRMGNDYDFYNLVEKCLFESELTHTQKHWID
jgi:hypothetical protein